MKLEEVLDPHKAKEAIEELRKEMKNSFSSHDFIHKYSKKCKQEYAEKLREVNESDPRLLHSLMARYLDSHANELGIEKEDGKRDGKGDPTIYGNETKVQGWTFKKQ